MWISVTKKENSIIKPGTLVNMDRIVEITPLRNEGCLLKYESGKEVNVLELLNYFDNLTSTSSKEKIVSSVIEEKAHTEHLPPSEEILDARILEVIKNSVRGPNSELKKRIKTMIREVMEEGPQIEEVKPSNTLHLPNVSPNNQTKTIANTSRNISG